MEDSKKFIELAVGSVSNRAFAIEPDTLSKYLKPNQELYRSLFVLDDTAFNHFKDQKTIKSYKGNFSLDKIVFDIDKGKNSGEDTVLRTKHFIEALFDMGLNRDLIRVWFSGRGFHVEIPDVYGFEPSTKLPYIVKLTLDDQFGDMIDNIYDRGRLIRVGYSYNLKSHLYKTPILLEEIDTLSYNEIADLCKEFFTRSYEPLPTDVEKIWGDKIKLPPQEATETEYINNTSKYNANVTCVQKMWDSDKKGKRHIVLLRMANAWRRMGLNKEATTALAIQNVPSLEPNEITRLVEDVYKWEHKGYGCNDVIMSSYCDPVCKYYKRKNYGTEVYSSLELSDRLRDFIHTDFSSNSFNLKEIYPTILEDYRFMPGELAVLLGDTKLGKTAFLQNIVCKLHHLNVLYLSLEVNEWMIYRRFLQVANRMTKDQISTIYKYNDEERIEQLVKSVQHINVMTVPPDIDSMKQLISDLQPGVVCIDTMDAIDVKFCNDPFTKAERVVNSLKQIANQQDVIIFGISHISKSASREVLSVHSAKGNSAIEQKADKILGIMGDRDSTSRRIIKSLASRDENGFELACDFKYETFEFKELTC
tara:strand:+ start:1578 stop:3347 length:1770 start_codon:yes stop_codon:yes gene_type:complete